MPSLSIWPLLQTTITRVPHYAGSPVLNADMRAPDGAGNQVVIGREVLSGSHIDKCRDPAVPISRTNLPEEIEVYEDMLRPW